MQILYYNYTPTPRQPLKECTLTTGRGQLNGQTSPGEHNGWGKREEEDRACRSGRSGGRRFEVERKEGEQEYAHNNVVKGRWGLEVSVDNGISPSGRKGKNNSVQKITQQAREENEGRWRSGRRGVEDFKSGMEEESKIVHEVRQWNENGVGFGT
ncbi:Uncharacterized protein Adt_22698 [Abeliophyllum distichum]|uniref:Uncharacterized protein n=1 Tax=Abeliophyllum distichum TaxID=126358 RepID=A0ABD1S8S8_9LAMI